MRSIFKKRRNIVIAFAAIVLLWFLYKALKPKPLPVVKTTTVATNQSLIETIEVDGKIHPINEVRVTASTSGQVVELYVKEGDKVTKGQALAKISNKGGNVVLPNMPDFNKMQAAMQLQPLQMAYAQAKSAYERANEKMKNGQGNVMELNMTKMMADRAKEELDKAKRNTSSTNQQAVKADGGGSTILKATIDGTVLSISTKVGETVGNTMGLGGGAEVMRIADLTQMEIRTEVGEREIIKIENGDSVMIEANAFPNENLGGKVWKVAQTTSSSTASNALGAAMGNAADAANYKVHVWIANNQLPLKPGMNARIKIITQVKNDINTIPIKALSTRFLDSTKSKKPSIVVFTVDENNKAVQKVISIGIQDVSNVEVLSGLSAKDVVITEPFELIEKTLETGTKVKIKN
jgi:HlyD family secretion protein